VPVDVAAGIVAAFVDVSVWDEEAPNDNTGV